MTTTTPAPTEIPATRAAHYRLAVFALAVGGFAIGTTEFVTMGLLPQIAEGVGVSIPAAGHVIAAYALGVVVGAPLIAMFGAKLPRRALLIWLMVAYAGVQPAQRGRDELRRAVRGALPRRAAARRLLRRRLTRGGEHGGARPARPRGRQRDARPLGRERRRSARGDLARPAARLARGVPVRREPRAAHRRADPRVRAVLPGQPGGHRPSRAAVLPQRPGDADAARRRGRLRWPVRGLLLHRPDRHRGGWPPRLGDPDLHRRRSASAWCSAPGWRAGWPSGTCSGP